MQPRLHRKAPVVDITLNLYEGLRNQSKHSNTLSVLDATILISWIFSDTESNYQCIGDIEKIAQKLKNILMTIHKYPIQFHYSYWWRARHMAVFKRLIKT